jgi:hypothetical protein
MQVSNNAFKRIVQLFVLIILASAALLVLFISARLFIRPVEGLPPTIHPLVPSIGFSVTVTDTNHAMVIGTTDLPDNTMLTISIDQEKGNYYSEEKVAVLNGGFSSMQFGPGEGLEYGPYTIQVVTVPSSEQPESVQERFGPDGVNLVGEFVNHGDKGAFIKAEARIEVVRPAPVLRSLTGDGVGPTRTDTANAFELTVQSAYKTSSAFGEDPTAPANREYGNEFVFVEITYRNIAEESRFLSYVDFILFVNEEFALTDINVPYTYYPDGRFTVLQEAKDYGFFSIQEIQPGESFTGMIAFMVPEISHHYVFSSNATSCIEQEGTLQCFEEFPTYTFND